LHVSVPLQELPSSQSALVSQAQPDGSLVQPSSTSEQLSRVQAIPSLHVTIAPPQRPAAQTSPLVQVKPSLHDEPSGFVGFEQTPVEGLQTPASWQASCAPHVRIWPVHEPPLQASP
jgi:hypothetical protein